MTLMIALVGEQLLPNFLPVRHYLPEETLFVYTERTRPHYEKLGAVLGEKTHVIGLEADPYDIGKISHALRSKLASREHAGKSLQFNSTGGTKMMSLAAYQLAQEFTAPLFYLQSEGKQNRVYHYTWDNRQLVAASDEIMPECIQLSDFFNLHLGLQSWSAEGPTKAEGGPLEEAIALTLQANGYEVMTGVKALGNQIDIDVAIRSENRFAILEAKWGEKGRKLDGIKQLSNAVRHLGTYTNTFYVITVQPSESHEAITTASRIQVVSLRAYEAGARSLGAEDTSKLLEAVNKVMK